MYIEGETLTHRRSGAPYTITHLKPPVSTPLGMQRLVTLAPVGVSAISPIITWEFNVDALFRKGAPT